MVAGATADDPRALILSTRRMNAIRSVSPEDNVLVAEAGAILSDVHDAAEAAGRRFPLSLAAKRIGDGGRPRLHQCGRHAGAALRPMRALVLGIEAVLPDGSVFDGLSALRKDNRGYDLRQLLAGAEGTSGVITAAALRLVPAVGSRTVGWVGLATAEDALSLLRRLEAATGEAIESFEIVPADALDLVLAHIPGTRAPLAGRHGWHVLIEAVSPQGAEPPLLAELILDSGLAEDAVIAMNEAQGEARSGGCARASPRPSGWTAWPPGTTSPCRSPPCRASWARRGGRWRRVSSACG